MKHTKPAVTKYTKEKYLLAFLLGFLALAATLLPIVIVNGGYFIYCGDYNAQQIPFYNMANDTVRSGGFGWNWLTDLGSDFMTSYSFYLFGSPFFWLTTILPRGLVTYSMWILIGIKHGLASVTAYAYIRRFVRSKEAALIGGLLYASSGFQAYNIFFNHFHDVTALFPLMLIAMEENINNRRKGVFALIVAVMAVNNYYFFSGQVIFLILYYIFRALSPDFKTSWKKFTGLAFEAIAGTMIAGFILLPSAIAVSTNSRVSEFAYGQDMVIYFDKTLIPRIIQSLFMPPDPPACPILFGSDYEKWASIGAYLPLFSMAGVFAFAKKNKRSWASRLSLCCLVFAFIPILNSLFQAVNSYYYARWFYMPILILAMMTANALDDEESDMIFGWKICTAFVAGFAVIGMLPVEGSGKKPKFFRMPEYIPYFWILIAVAAAGLVTSMIIFRLKAKKHSYMKLSVWATFFACVISISTTAYFTAESIRYSRYYKSSVLENDNCVYEKVSEDNFFRIDISEGCDNYSMVWGLPNMRAFQSVVSSSIMDFYKSIGIDRNVASRAELDSYTLRGLFSVKYYYRDLYKAKTYSELEDESSSSEADLHSIISSDKDDDDTTNTNITEALPGFEYIGENGYYEYYENSLYIPMGFAYDNYISEKRAEGRTTSQRERLLLKALVLDEEQIEKYSDILTEYTSSEKLGKNDYLNFCKEKQQMASSSFSYDSHGFESKITLDKPGLVFFSVPYSDGWSAEVNGKEADVEKVSYGFMAVKADAGESTIVFRYKTPGLDAGIIITITGIILLAGYLLLCRFVFKDKNDETKHTHFYDYTSSQKVSASQEYCEKLLRKE